MKTSRIVMLTALITGIAHAAIEDRIEYKLNRPNRPCQQNEDRKEKRSDKEETRKETTKQTK